MKIALVLHGYFDSLMDRSSKGVDGYRHIEKNILSKGNVDTYLHSWSVKEEDEIRRLYNPINWIIEPQKDFTLEVMEKNLHLIKNPPRPAFTIFSHFYSIWRAFSLISDFSQYDVIIKSRFDLGRINRNTSGPGRMNPYPVQCINFDPLRDMNFLYMADWNMLDQGPADMWFYSGPNIMKNFTSIYGDICFYLNPNSDYTSYISRNVGVSDIPNAVRLYKWWMQDKNIWDKKVLLSSEWE